MVARHVVPDDGLQRPQAVRPGKAGMNVGNKPFEPKE